MAVLTLLALAVPSLMLAVLAPAAFPERENCFFEHLGDVLDLPAIDAQKPAPAKAAAEKAPAKPAPPAKPAAATP